MAVKIGFWLNEWDGIIEMQQWIGVNMNPSQAFREVLKNTASSNWVARMEVQRPPILVVEKPSR